MGLVNLAPCMAASMLSASMLSACLLSACLLSLGLLPAHAVGPQEMKPAGPSSGVRYGLVIAGLGGETKYVEQHLAWARGFYEVLKTEHGYPEDRLFLLVEDPDAAGGPPAVKSTLEEIRAALTELARMVRPNDDLFVLLIGHGSATGTGARLNIPGPDLTADTLRDALDEIGARYTVVVNGASSSAPFIDALSGPGRVIVTATKSGAERLSTVFPEHLLDALKAQAGDLDKDGRVSVLESFIFARNRTAEWYVGQGLLATEHALLDDNGDGRGTREPGPGGTDGTLSGRIYFGRGPGGPEATAGTVPPGGQALQARIEELRWLIDDLRARKDQEDPGEYAARMEEMLIELARVTRQLRELQTPEDQSP
ncbi:MAG: hypothetical protein OXH56_11925 [Gemmatimonadetes bacterium]|nr:hypothetical protein [Gemmatimonadota bacterium]